MPWQSVDQFIDLFLSIVKMRRSAQSPFAQGDFSVKLLTHSVHDVIVIELGRDKTDDSTPVETATRADDLISLHHDAKDQAIG